MTQKISEQQTQTDAGIEEILPEEMSCPVCGSRAIQCTTKRGIHYKCQREECGFDSNRPFDFNMNKRKEYINHCANVLKKLVPKINIMENFGYNPDIFYTGNRDKEQKTKYDFSVYFNGMKLQKVRVEINHSLTKEQFFDSKFCYVMGRPEVVEYLASRKGLVAHFLVDEPKEKIGISRMDQVVKICPMEKDNFGNQQYFIKKEYRPVLVTFDPAEIEDLLFYGFHRKIYQNIMIK
jgi:predicted RNA-binding Zn-ribbon protein involved in translation (DUF1610 family)